MRSKPGDTITQGVESWTCFVDNCPVYAGSVVFVVDRGWMPCCDHHGNMLRRVAQRIHAAFFKKDV